MAEDNPRLPTEAPANDAAKASASPADAPSPPTSKAKRRKWLIILVIVVAAAALVALAYHFIVGVRHVATDNAYVGADTAQVTPLVAGAVTEVRVANTQYVQRGQVLVTIDSADARVVVDRAAADLAQAERKLRETQSTGGSLSAQITARSSDVERARAEQVAAQADYQRVQTDLQRREKLSGAGAVSGEELTNARNAQAQARAHLAVTAAAIDQAIANRRAAQEDLAANRALTAGAARDNPEVAAARARLDAAKLDLARTVIRAPFGGIVAQRNVQVGQRVAPGTPIMTVVPTDAMYVDANFKEGQLRKVRVGQHATLTADIYGGNVVYHGRVIGMAGGTGSAFAIIPAQNATGNWIKVVQRVPVRIALDAKELRDHPLRVGLSMDVDIDVAD